MFFDSERSSASGYMAINLERAARPPFKAELDKKYLFQIIFSGSTLTSRLFQVVRQHTVSQF